MSKVSKFLRSLCNIYKKFQNRGVGKSYKCAASLTQANKFAPNRLNLIKWSGSMNRKTNQRCLGHNIHLTANNVFCSV